jgi:hypothetical protein
VADLIIWDGNFESIVNLRGAGIGSGYAWNGFSTLNNLTIKNGTFNVTGLGSGPGIGSGFTDYGNSSVDNIVIENGVFAVVAGSYAAGIGTGYSNYGNSTINTLTILNGFFRINSSIGGAGIGTGYTRSGNSTLRSIRIANGVFEVAGGSNAPGMGSGSSSRGNSSLDSIIIENGDFTIAGHDSAAGIGNVAAQSGISSLNRLVIRNGSITASGYFGIGNVSTLELLGPGSLTLNCSSRNLSCISASRIIWGPGTFNGKSNTRTFVSQSANASSGNTVIYGEYSVRSTRDSFGSSRVLHFGELPQVGNGNYTLAITEIDTRANATRIIEFNRSETAGLVISVENPGVYEIYANDEQLCYGGESSISVGDGEAYYSDIIVCGTQGLSVGVLVAIIVGSVVLVIALGIVVFCIIKKRSLAKPARAGHRPAHLLEEGAPKTTREYTGVPDVE